MTNSTKESTLINRNLYELSALHPTKVSLYEAIREKLHIILPDLYSNTCSVNYLNKCASKEVFTISEDKFKYFNLNKKRHLTVEELILEVKNLTDKALGFDAITAPDRNWLTSVIYSLKPIHSMFVSEKPFYARQLPKE